MTILPAPDAEITQTELFARQARFVQAILTCEVTLIPKLDPQLRFVRDGSRTFASANGSGEAWYFLMADNTRVTVNDPSSVTELYKVYGQLRAEYEYEQRQLNRQVQCEAMANVINELTGDQP